MVSKKTKITLIKKYLAPLVNQVDLDNLIIEEYGFLTTDQYEAYIKKTTWKVGRFELFCVLSLSAEAREPAVLDKEPL